MGVIGVIFAERLGQVRTTWIPFVLSCARMKIDMVTILNIQSLNNRKGTNHRILYNS